MEFTGLVSKVLPVRTWKSQKTGNDEQSLPFVFEYFENPTDRFPDSVVLESMDEKVIKHLKEGMEIRCGFSHRVFEYKGNLYNKLRVYKIESVKKAANKPAEAVTPAPQAPIVPQATPPAQQQQQEADDLPF